MDVTARLEELARRHPSRTAVFDGRTRLDTRGLAERVATAAGGDACRGPVVGVALQGIDGVVATLAAWSVGAPVLVLDPADPVAVQDRLVAAAAGPAAGSSINGRGPSSAFVFASGAGDDVTRVQIDHRSLAATVAALGLVATGPVRIGVVGAPGSTWAALALRALLDGHELHVAPASARRDPGRLVEFVTEHGVDVVDVSVGRVGDLLDTVAQPQGTVLPATVVVDGAVTNRRTWARLAAADGAVLALHRPARRPDRPFVVRVEGHHPHLGHPVGATAEGRDGRGRPTPDWVTGELHVSLPGAGAGAGVDGSTGGTGDRVRRRPDGTIELVATDDRLRIIDGQLVDVVEVERAIAALPGVDSAMASFVEGAEGPAVVGVAVGAEPLGEGTIAAALAERLAHAHRPIAVEVRTPGGRLPPSRRHLSRSHQVAVARQVGAGGPPATADERTVAAIVELVLGRTGVGRLDSFFDLGGDSIGAVQLAAELERATGRELSLRDLFLRPTVADLAAGLPGMPVRTGGSGEPSGWTAAALDRDASAATIERRPLLALVAGGEQDPVDAAAFSLLPDELLTLTGVAPSVITQDWCQDLPVVVNLRRTGHGSYATILLPRFAAQVAADPVGILPHLGTGLRMARSLGASRTALLGTLATLTDDGRSTTALELADGLPSITTGHATVAAAVVLAMQLVTERVDRPLESETVCFLGAGSVGAGALELALASLAHPASILVSTTPSGEPDARRLLERVRHHGGFAGPTRFEPLPGPAPAAVYDASLVVATTTAVSSIDVDRLRPGTILVDYSAPRSFDMSKASTRAARDQDVLFTNGGALRSPTDIDEVRHLPAGAELLVPPSAIDVALDVDVREIAACQLASLLAGTGGALEPVIGPPGLEACRRHRTAVLELGYQAAPIGCDGFVFDDDALDRFAARFGNRNAPAGSGWPA